MQIYKKEHADDNHRRAVSVDGIEYFSRAVLALTHIVVITAMVQVVEDAARGALAFADISAVYVVEDAAGLGLSLADDRAAAQLVYVVEDGARWALALADVVAVYVVQDPSRRALTLADEPVVIAGRGRCQHQ